MNAKTYYSLFIQTPPPTSSSSSLTLNSDNCNDKIIESKSHSRHNSSFFDTSIPSLYYRIGSVGQDNRLCFWDITEDILKINKIDLSNPSNLNKEISSDYSVLLSPSNGYSSFLSDTTVLKSTASSTVTRKSSFTSLTARLSFSRNSNKIHRSNNNNNNTLNSPLVTVSNDRSKSTRKSLLLSGTKHGSKSISLSSTNTTSISNDNDHRSLTTLTNNNNSLFVRRTNFDLTKNVFGTSLCPRLDEIQVIEPIVTELISNERLNGIVFGENYLVTSSQDGIISIWEKPQIIH